MQVAIVAGGLATRLMPLTEQIPKSMIRIHDKPFLEYQFELLKRQGITDIVLCVGYLGEQIEEYFGDGSRFGVHLKYSYEREQLLGTAGALKNAGELLAPEFIVVNGDTYFLIDFADIVSYFKQSDKLGLMIVHKNFDRYDTSNTVIEGNMVMQYSKKEKTGEMVYVDYGASLFREGVLELVPENHTYSLEELNKELIKKQELLAYEVTERFYEIGSPQGLADFKKYEREAIRETTRTIQKSSRS